MLESLLCSDKITEMGFICVNTFFLEVLHPVRKKVIFFSLFSEEELKRRRIFSFIEKFQLIVFQKYLIYRIEN